MVCSFGPLKNLNSLSSGVMQIQLNDFFSKSILVIKIKSLFSKYSDIWLKITFSNIFDIEGSMDIGL